MKLRAPKTRPAATSPLAEPLQQVDRTFVMCRSRRLIYFGGCDYFRMASHPEVLRAAQHGLETFGLNVSASRRTSGNHPLYEELERDLATFFDTKSAVLVSSGYVTNLVVAQALAGEFTHALIDERAHACLLDAAQLLGCPTHTFAHRDALAAAAAARRCGPRAKLLVLTDGLYGHDGCVAPLADYLKLLPRNTTLLVDDAHGAGTLGRTGRGTLEHLGVSTERIIQTITLSKAFGAYGGAILGTRSLREKIAARSRLFIGNTPVPLPLAAAAQASLRLVNKDAGFRRRLAFNTSYVKAALAESGLPVSGGPGPMIPLLPKSPVEARRLERALLEVGILPPLLRYMSGPAHGYFRFVISSEHNAAQLDALVGVLQRFHRA